MANTKKTTTAKSATSTKTTEMAETSTGSATATASPAPISNPKKVVKLDDSILITVKSNTYGELIYINSRTGDMVKWAEFGDEQDMTMGDLRSMKGTQRSFYEKNWITIVSVAEDGYPASIPM